MSLRCINDKKTIYIGTEPSPKGFGYCAHAEKINTIKKGKDGNIWIVKKNNSGIKRWMLHTIISAKSKTRSNTRSKTRGKNNSKSNKSKTNAKTSSKTLSKTLSKTSSKTRANTSK